MSQQVDDEKMLRTIKNVNNVKDVNYYNSREVRPMSIMRFIGIRKSFIINNKCDFRAKIILSATPIGRITKIGITGKFGANAEIQWSGRDRQSMEVLAPGVSRKMYSSTSSSYVTILIEIDSDWKLLRKDKLINNWRHSYNILQRHMIECIDIPLNHEDNVSI